MNLTSRILIFILVTYNVVFANQTLDTTQIKRSKSISLDISTINGTSKEYVYEGHDKISELIWRLNDVKLLGITSSIDITPKVTFSGMFKMNINTFQSTMDDYDWLALSLTDKWTDWSNHPDTTVKRVLKIDINFKHKTIITKNGNLYTQIGFKHDQFKWTAKGGSYIYSRNALRDTTGNSPNGMPVISYNQYFNSLYIGLGTNYKKQNLIINTHILYTPSVKIKDEDTHHARNLYFEDSFSNGTLIEYGLNLSYIINKQFSFIASYITTDYKLRRGDTKVSDANTGEVYGIYLDSVGISHKSNLLSCGIKYSF